MSDTKLQSLGQRNVPLLTDVMPVADSSYYAINLTNITQANPAVVTTFSAHGFINGDQVCIIGVNGMTQVNGNTYTVANAGSTTFELSGTNSTGFSAYVSGGTAIRGRLQYMPVQDLAVALPSAPGGRLSLESGVPVSSADQSQVGTLYYTPLLHNGMQLYDGTRWRSYTTAGINLTLTFSSAFTRTGNTTNGSNSVTSLSSATSVEVGFLVTGTGIPTNTHITSVSGTTITLSRNATANNTGVTLTFYPPHDVFGYVSGGAPAMELLAWLRPSARATAVTLQDGRYCKNGDKTRLYLGTVHPSTASASDDTATARFVWNAYNRRLRPVLYVDTTSSWNYSTATLRLQNGVLMPTFMCINGLSEDTTSLKLNVFVASTVATDAIFGVGLDSVTALSDSGLYVDAVPGSADGGNRTCTACFDSQLGAGWHMLNWLEKGAGTGTQTWHGASSGAIRSGLTGTHSC